LLLALGLGVRDAWHGGQGQHMDKEQSVTLTKDVATPTQGPKKDKKHSGKRRPSVVGISDEVQDSEWLRGSSPRALKEMVADWHEALEVRSVAACPVEMCRPTRDPPRGE
jgi:hypothetical protein